MKRQSVDVLLDNYLKAKTLFHTKRNLLCLVCQFSLCSAMYFSLHENMMCSMSATWLVGHSNSKYGGRVTQYTPKNVNVNSSRSVVSVKSLSFVWAHDMKAAH